MEYVKIVIGVDAGMAGTDSWEFYKVNANSDDKARSDFAWECAKAHAEMYGIYPRYEYAEAAEENGEEFEDDDSYSDNIEGWWEEYDPAKHDGHRIGGDNSWEEVTL